MNTIHTVVETVLAKQRSHLKQSTYEARKNYIIRLAEHGEKIGIKEPCQELYDSYVTSRSLTTELHFQLYHAVRLVDAEAATKAFTPEGKLYNEPMLPSMDDSDAVFKEISFPLEDGILDTGHLILRAKKEMEYLQLSLSTNWQYLQAWRELYISLYIKGDTIFTHDAVTDFINTSTQQLHAGKLQVWKWKIRRRSACILLEVASTGKFNWKLFRSYQAHCPDDTLDELRLQYMTFLQTRNLEKNTLALHDYSLRCLIEGIGIRSVSELSDLKPSQIQKMITALSDRLCINSRATIYPIIRQIFSYLYVSRFVANDYSGMILTPLNQRMHLRPYMTAFDEEKLFTVLQETPLRTRAMMRLAVRLGLRDIDICNLRFGQIDWNNDRIVLKQEKTGVTLFLPLLEDVGNSIMEYIVNERPTVDKSYPYIFIRSQAPHKKLSSMYNVCSRLLDKAGIKTVNSTSHGVHVCRYTLIHKLLKAKVPHQVITDTLGHVSKESDKPYLSMEEEMLRECPLSLSLIGQKYWEEGDGNV